MVPLWRVLSCRRGEHKVFAVQLVVYPLRIVRVYMFYTLDLRSRLKDPIYM